MPLSDRASHPAPPKWGLPAVSSARGIHTNCQVTFLILLHGGFSFRMFFKVTHSLSRNCQWQSIKQLVINHGNGLSLFFKKGVGDRKPWWKKKNPFQGRAGNRYLCPRNSGCGRWPIAVVSTCSRENLILGRHPGDSGKSLPPSELRLATVK